MYIDEAEKRDLDIIELLRLLKFLKKNKAIILGGFLLSFIGAITISFTRPNVPPFYKAMMSLELAKYPNGQPLDHLDDLTYLLKTKFNVSLKPIATEMLIEITAVDKDKRKARERVTNAFSFVKKRYEKLEGSKELQTKTNQIEEIVVKEVTKSKLKRVLKLVKIVFIGFILSILIILIRDFFRKTKKASSKVF
ncbi:MAG: hypothetical protein K9K67_00755 [Bacteriovoracaceae bacterium]|nr:hypothetical protein [Bacteriovoracaceae bacterium]